MRGGSDSNIFHEGSNLDDEDIRIFNIQIPVILGDICQIYAKIKWLIFWILFIDLLVAI